MSAGEVIFEPGYVVGPGYALHRQGGVRVQTVSNCVGLCAKESGARQVVQYSDSPWYGPDVYCECGDRYQDGEMSGRPFRRGWRKEAVAKFDEMWPKSLPAGTKVVRDWSDEGGGYISGVILPDGTVVSR